VCDHRKMIVEHEVPVQKYNQVKLGLHLHCWPRHKNSAQVKVQGTKKVVSVDHEFSCLSFKIFFLGPRLSLSLCPFFFLV
jgi:hypothetical protein